MTTAHNITLAPAATLTEKELWALFVTHTMQSTFSMGPTVERYKPDDLLRDPGIYGHTAQLSCNVADAAEEVDNPESELDCFIEDIECYLTNLKRVREDFNRLKDSLLIESDDDESLYRMPAIGDSREAA